MAFDRALRQSNVIGWCFGWLFYSNSYWIGEDTPCITYGLRGVVHATVLVSGIGPDLHSGVEGGSITEPMVDMFVLSTFD